MTRADLLAEFDRMTLLELSEFVKEFEDHFGVTAAVPVLPVQQAEQQAEPETEEQTEFTLILEAAGDKKIQVIKEVRTITGLGLKEAKDTVDAAPKMLLENVTREAADKAKASLEAAGATVTVK